MRSAIPAPDGSSIHTSMHSLLSQRHAKSSLRALSITPPNHVDFSSNDFLSLSTSPLLRQAFLSELRNHPEAPLGSRGSRLLDGNSLYAENLESSIAAFHNAPSGLLFNSGFDANAGFFSCVPQRGDVIVYDEYIHASVHEGMKLSRAERKIPFKHNCVVDLRNVLEELERNNGVPSLEGSNVFVAVEGLYSMDGDLAPLKAITEVVESVLSKGNGLIVVDEAHSTGIYGIGGRGIVSSLGLERRVFARLHTFGKAMGCNGAIILCDQLTRAYLINYARPLIYSTFMSFPSLASIKASYSLLATPTVTLQRQHLFALIRQLHTLLLSLPKTHLLTVPAEIPQSPIFALMTPEPRKLASWCQADAFMVRPIVSPTVPVGLERVRVCLHAGNTFHEVERLVKRIEHWIEEEARKEERELRAEDRARL